MSHIEQTIEELENQIQQKQREVDGLQMAVNSLCQLLNLPPKYEIKGQSANRPALKLKGDEYFRRPTATVITLILDSRKAIGAGPAAIDEIYNKMLEGGYVFDVKDPTISIGTALGKNPKFTRVGDKWGLTEWYPKAKEDKPDANGAKAGPIINQPQQEAEIPMSKGIGLDYIDNLKKKVGRPKKTEQIDKDKQE